MPKLEIVRYDEADPLEEAPDLSLATAAAVHTANPLESMTAQAICAMAFAPQTYLIHRTAAQGAITELIGKLKRGGKTTFLLHAIKAATTGKKFLDRPTTKTSVVYLTEQSPRVIKEQLTAAGLDTCADLHIVLWHKTYGRKWPSIVRDARALAKDVGAKILVVDTIGAFTTTGGADSEQSQLAALDAINPLKAAAAQDHLAVIIVQHERKAAGDIADAARGHGALSGAVDVLMVIRSKGGHKSNVRTNEGIGRLEGAFEMTVELHSSGYVLTEEDGVQVTQAAPFVPVVGTIYTLKAMKEITGSTEAAREAVDGFLAAGKFKRTKHNEWEAI